MKILFTASESLPFIKTGGLGDVAYALPKALADAGHEVKVIIPFYGRVKHGEALSRNINFVGETKTPLGWRNQYTGVFRYGSGGSNPEYWFIDNEYYFSRSDGYAIYGDYDDGEKFAFFSRAVLQALPLMGFDPDIIHCNDWQTALVPLFLHRFYPQYRNAKTVFTVHNIEYQGKMPPDFAFDVLGLNREDTDILNYAGCVNLMKAGIVMADAVTTVSQSYADEILGEFHSHGLHYILHDCRGKLSGIVNGIDTVQYDPARDRNLFMNYDASSFEKKKRNKLFLQEKLGLRPDPDAPLAVMVSRFAAHKGFDLVEAALDDIMAQGIQLAVLGTGDRRYEEMFREAAGRYHGRLSAWIAFDTALASQMYAGADIFLMPSLSEPCGLAQMVAMRYGCVPVVRETGGLRDTVPAYNPVTGEGRGFTFVDYSPAELVSAVRRCADFCRNDRAGFTALAKRDMACDFSWHVPVKKYEELYTTLVG